MDAIGARLRRIRLANGDSIDALGRRVGVSKGYLSRIENGQASPSIAVLAKLAGAYGVPMAAFFDAEGEATRISVVRREERLALSRAGVELGYQYDSIAFRKPDRLVEAFVVTLPPVDAPRHFYSHPGEELFFILFGQVRFLYGTAEYILNAGDCAYFDAMVEHRGDAHGAAEAQALAVIIPPADRRVGARSTAIKNQDTEEEKSHDHAIEPP